MWSCYDRASKGDNGQESGWSRKCDHDSAIFALASTTPWHVMAWSMALITAQDWSGDPVKPLLPASGVRHNRLPEALLNPQLPQLSLCTIKYPSYYRIVTPVQKDLSHVRVNEELADFAYEGSRLVDFQNLIPNEICPSDQVPVMTTCQEPCPWRWKGGSYLRCRLLSNDIPNRHESDPVQSFHSADGLNILQRT